jgi:hypothetical protein
MIAARHQHPIPVAHQRYRLWLFSIVVHHPDPERRRGHVEGYIHFFEHRGVFVRPTGPVMPLFKISTNTPTFARLLDAASGRKTVSESLGHKEFVPWRIGPVP